MTQALASASCEAMEGPSADVMIFATLMAAPFLGLIIVTLIGMLLDL